MDILIEYAKSFVGRPYIWGGDDPMRGFDCSGFIQEVLSSVGCDPPGDQTAQALYNYFSGAGKSSWTAPGSLVFYGRNLTQVSHVAMVIDDFRIIEAAGGGSKTLTEADAIKHNAYIRIRPLHHRKDLLEVIRPYFYDEQGLI